jgi:hypothetical protein
MSDPHVNFLLHGLFFMEFGTALAPLVLTAPDSDMHFYCMGTKGAVIPVSQHGAQVTIDLRNFVCDLAEGYDSDFHSHPEIPQFSKSAAGTGNIIQPGCLQLLLGIPKQIIPLRRGKLSDFDIVAASGRVKDSVMASCAGNGNQFSLVTCFRYKRKDPHFAPPDNTVCFFAEHEHTPSPDEMNSTYSDAGGVFDQKLFDLRLTNKTPTQETVPRDPNPGSGIAPEDEASLAELLHGEQHRAINVANCVQFGLLP